MRVNTDAQKWTQKERSFPGERSFCYSGAPSPESTVVSVYDSRENTMCQSIGHMGQRTQITQDITIQAASQKQKEGAEAPRVYPVLSHKRSMTSIGRVLHRGYWLKGGTIRYSAQVVSIDSQDFCNPFDRIKARPALPTFPLTNRAFTCARLISEPFYGISSSSAYSSQAIAHFLLCQHDFFSDRSLQPDNSWLTFYQLYRYNNTILKVIAQEEKIYARKRIDGNSPPTLISPSRFFCLPAVTLITPIKRNQLSLVEASLLTETSPPLLAPMEVT